MNKKSKLILLKSGLFTASLVISLIASEIILSHFLQKYQLPQQFIPENNLSTDEIKSLKTKLNYNRHADVYEIFKAHKNDLEIITVGDSYTNGGNVSWNETYPFKLFQKLDKKFPVANMGVCEDTTKGSYMRIKSYFETKKSQAKKTIVVVLVGAADIFYDSGPAFENFYNKFINEGHVSSAEINFKIEAEENFWKDLKTVKMFQYIIFKGKEGLSRFRNSFQNEDSVAPLLKDCFNAKKDGRNTCFISRYEQMKNDKNLKIDGDFYKKITNLIIYNNSSLPDKEIKIIEDLLLAIQTFPKMPGVPEVVYNLVSFTTLQSQYTINEDIIPVLKKYNELENKVLQSAETDTITQSESLISALEKWSSNLKHATEVQKSYYEKIIEMVQLHHGEIIFLTYPLNYKATNAQILKLAEKKNVHVVDVTKIFSDLNKKGLSQDELIGDWEHCTPEGYGFIATAVADKIMNITKRN